jgi:ribosome-binding ATPase YchF (GTP1/OBG family)
MSELTYNEKLDALNGQFESLLDDFKKYYVFSNKNPEYQDYTNAYTQVKANIQNINSQVFKITSETESALTKLIDDATDINAKIDAEKKTQLKLKKNLGLIQSNTNSANLMIMNYKELYNEQYIKNVTTFIGIFLVVYTILKVYTPQSR